MRIFTIGLPSPDNDFGTLNLLAAGTRGEFSSAGSIRDLTRIYDRLGSRLASQYLHPLPLRARGPHERVVVEVSVDGLAGSASAEYNIARAATGRPRAFPPLARLAALAVVRTVVIAIAIAALLRRLRRSGCCCGRAASRPSAHGRVRRSPA